MALLVTLGASTGPDPYVPHRGSSAYTVERYDLDLDYRPATNALTGRAVLSVLVREPLDQLRLDLVGLGVDRVSVDGRRVRWRQRVGVVLVELPEAEARGARLQVEVRYSGEPGPQAGPWGEVGWEELTDGVLVAGQPDGAPTWFPCNDLPGDRAALRTTVRTDSGYEVAAPGVLVERRQGGSRTSWTFAQREPTAPYLATVQLGRYGRTALPGPVPVTLLAPARLRQHAQAALARQPAMLELFERLFGPYPFAGYTVVVTDDDLDIPLEAQGMAVLGANHLDAAHERLVAHELAHQWFGNSVGVAAWRHVWLNEGPACYAEWLWSERSGGPSADALARQWHARLAALPQDLVLADPGPALMFDDRVYKRGALTLHALRRTVGDDAFFGLLRSWTAGRGTVTTQDLVTHTGQAELLHRWTALTALPSLPPPH